MKHICNTNCKTNQGSSSESDVNYLQGNSKHSINSTLQIYCCSADTIQRCTSKLHLQTEKLNNSSACECTQLINTQKISFFHPSQLSPLSSNRDSYSLYILSYYFDMKLIWEFISTVHFLITTVLNCSLSFSKYFHFISLSVKCYILEMHQEFQT